MLLPELGELLVANASDEVVRVVEEHHRGRSVDGALELFARLDFDEVDAAVAHRVVVAEAVRLLHDDLAPRSGQVREIDDLLLIGAGEHGRGAERQRRRRAGGDHDPLAAQERRQPRPDLVVQLVEHHVVLRGVLDGGHDLGGHEGGRHRGVGARGIDERADAELGEVVAAGSGRDGRGPGLARPEPSADEGKRRRALEETSSAPHSGRIISRVR